MIDPIVSVIMPIFNCQQYARESIESVLNQTFKNFEFLIIDDASTDQTVDIIKSYKDERIKLIEKPKNDGYTNSLNYGLKIAKGKYIARMDADDISMPERFEKQVAFLELNSKTVLCGASYSIIGSNEFTLNPQYNEDIKLGLLWTNCIAHPSVMLRAQTLKEFSLFYDVSKEPSEDYDLWVRLLNYGELYNLPQILLQYRVHDTQVSILRQNVQKNIGNRIRCSLLLSCLETETSELNKEMLFKVLMNEKLLNLKEIKLFIILKSDLVHSNSNSKPFFEPIAFQNFLNNLESTLLNKCFINRSSYSPKVFFDFLIVKNKINKKFKLKVIITLFVKSFSFWRVKKTSVPIT